MLSIPDAQVAFDPHAGPAFAMLLWASSFIALKLAFRFYVNLIPVFTAILGWIVPGEQFTFIQYAACALVFMGVLLSRDRQSVWGLPGVQ